MAAAAADRHANVAAAAAAAANTKEQTIGLRRQNCSPLLALLRLRLRALALSHALPVLRALCVSLAS